MTYHSQLKEGDLVRVHLPRRRSFDATVKRVGRDTVDLIDPRNGGWRTIPVHLVRKRRRRRAA